MFGPLGFLGQVTVRTKLSKQTLLEDGYGWNEILPHDISKLWREIRDDCEEQQLSCHYSAKKKDGASKDISLNKFDYANPKAHDATAYQSN